MNNFYEVIQEFFDKINIDVIEFDYNEETNSYITKEPFTLDDETQLLYMIVKLYNNVGTVIIGYPNGSKFIETETLGQIMYDNNKWISLL